MKTKYFRVPVIPNDLGRKKIQHQIGIPHAIIEERRFVQLKSNCLKYGGSCLKYGGSCSIHTPRVMKVIKLPKVRMNARQDLDIQVFVRRLGREAGQGGLVVGENQRACTRVEIDRL